MWLCGPWLFPLMCVKSCFYADLEVDNNIDKLGS